MSNVIALTAKSSLVWMMLVVVDVLYERQLIHERTAYHQHQRYRVYDYVVVGAGSAGTIVACRLSAITNATVLLLEAGGPADALINDLPGMADEVMDYDKQFWSYTTEAQVDIVQNKNIVQKAGKILGGGSTVNNMVYIRGSREYYNNLGITGWSYNDLLPYFKLIENNTNPSAAADSTNGPIGVSTINNISWLMDIQQTLNNSGLPIVNLNDDTVYGIAVTPKSYRDCQRQSTVQSYIERNDMCPELDILTKALAVKLLINRTSLAGKPKVYGLEFIKDNTKHTVTVDKEVILSAGAIESPKLLMLSGIGPKQHLDDVGVTPVWSDIPAVGQGYQTHPSVTLDFVGNFTLNKTVANLGSILTNVQQLYEANIRHTGALCDAPAELTIMWNSNLSENNTNYPDIKYQLTASGSQLKIKISVVRCKSTGSIKLRATDPKVPPIVNQNLLKHKDDKLAFLDAIANAFRLVEETPLFGQFTTIKPVQAPGCEYCTNSSIPLHKCSEYHKCIMKMYTTSEYHYVGTCRMSAHNNNTGTENSVVDERLRVRGVHGLRIVDLSIYPDIVNADPNPAALLAGERGVHFIIEDNHKNINII